MSALLGSVPADWDEVRLEDACDILAGPSGARLHVEPRTSINVPVITPQDLRNNRIVGQAATAVPVSYAEQLSRYRVRYQDVVVARTGALGNQGLVEQEQDGWLIGTGCLRLRPDSKLDAGYLTYYLDHPKVRDWVIRNGTGSAIPSLTAKTLGALPTLVPPTRIQTLIAATLGSFDEKIVVHEQIAQATRALRDKIAPVLFADSMLSQADPSSASV